MCLRIDERIHTEKLKGLYNEPKYFVAKSDIVCYKRLNPVFDEKYQYRTPYQDAKVLFDEGKAKIVSSKYGLYSPFSTTYDYSWSITEGVHSYISFDDSYSCLCGQFVFIAVIPKGSKYYIGTWGDIVSDELIVFEDSKAFYRYIKGKRMVTAEWLVKNFKKEKIERESIFFESVKNVFRKKSDLTHWVYYTR